MDQTASLHRKVNQLINLSVDATAVVLLRKTKERREVAKKTLVPQR